MVKFFPLVLSYVFLWSCENSLPQENIKPQHEPRATVWVGEHSGFYALLQWRELDPIVRRYYSSRDAERLELQTGEVLFRLDFCNAAPAAPVTISARITADDAMLRSLPIIAPENLHGALLWRALGGGQGETVLPANACVTLNIIGPEQESYSGPSFLDVGSFKISMVNKKIALQELLAFREHPNFHFLQRLAAEKQ